MSNPKNCVTTKEKADRFKEIVSETQSLRDVEDVNLSAQILDDISKHLENKNKNPSISKSTKRKIKENVSLVIVCTKSYYKSKFQN